MKCDAAFCGFLSNGALVDCWWNKKERAFRIKLEDKWLKRKAGLHSETKSAAPLTTVAKWQKMCWLHRDCTFTSQQRGETSTPGCQEKKYLVLSSSDIPARLYRKCEVRLQCVLDFVAVCGVPAFKCGKRVTKAATSWRWWKPIIHTNLQSNGLWESFPGHNDTDCLDLWQTSWSHTGMQTLPTHTHTHTH